MKIRVEQDNRLYKTDEPDIAVVEFEREVTDLGELLELFDDLTYAIGFRPKGTLEFVKPENLEGE